MVALQNQTGALRFDPAVGNLPALAFQWEGRALRPLHRAAWTDEPEALAYEAAPLVDRKLAGDFACAPFGRSDVETAPPHGWTANSAWAVRAQGPDWLEAALERPVMGARIQKRLELLTGAPLLAQTHVIEGGQGGLSFAHHPMVDVLGGARLSCSPKRRVLTNDFAIVEGAHALALDAAAADLAAVPGADGGPIDLRALPIAEDAEDFATLIEAASGGLGWTAVLRRREDDVVFFLRDVSVLPITMLWHSNGARKDYPWNGRNRGVLGVEDGRAAAAAGHRAALGDNRVRREGVPTAFELAPGRRHVIRHVLGAIPNHGGWRAVSAITLEPGALVLRGDAGPAVRLPFEQTHLFGEDDDGDR